MNRITICKTIIQFIKNILQILPNWNPIAPKIVSSAAVNSLCSTLLCIFFILPKLPCIKISLLSVKISLSWTFLPFPNRLFPKPGSLFPLTYLRSFSTSPLTFFTSISLPENFGMASIFSPLMAPNLNFLIPPLTSTFLENFLGIQILTASSPWLFPLLFMMSSMIISSTLLYIIILLPNVLPLSNISKSLKISGSSITVSLFLTGAIILRISSATVLLRGISVLCA